MAVEIHIEQASVQTATVDVKIIRLNKRQLTQSVFRQLEEEFIIGKDGKLKGTPWGRVNYTWKDNGPNVDCHVIWQSGSLLRRSPPPSKNLDAWKVVYEFINQLVGKFDHDGFDTMQEALTQAAAYYRLIADELKLNTRVITKERFKCKLKIDIPYVYCHITIPQESTKEHRNAD